MSFYFFRQELWHPGIGKIDLEHVYTSSMAVKASAPAGCVATLYKDISTHIEPTFLNQLLLGAYLP